MQKEVEAMRKFDYSFLNNGLLPANLVNITGGIYSLKNDAALRKSKNIKVFTELEKIAKVQSVKSSNAIEGIVTSDKRIDEIVNQSSAPLNHNESEIAGYRDALNKIHTEYNNISFNAQSILALHETMMTLSGDDSAGKYKQNDNVIIEVDSNGLRKVRFRPTPASETEQAMEQLELAYLDACSNSNINQLLLIPCVILDFLCIHPFRDGNGRMSRLLSLLLLYKNGFDVGKYISFEEQINNYKEAYYDALKKSSLNWEKNSNDYFPFMQNFLSTLYMCYKELDKRFAVVNGKKVTKTARIEATVLGSLIPISKAEICAIHPDISPSTVEAVLGKMVKSGQIKRIGASRGSRYIRNE
jgi:Fic family protein